MNNLLHKSYLVKESTQDEGVNTQKYVDVVYGWTLSANLVKVTNIFSFNQL